MSTFSVYRDGRWYYYGTHLPFWQQVREAQEVTALARQGHSYEEIGKILGHSHMWAWRRGVWLQEQLGYVGRLTPHHRVPLRGHGGKASVWWSKNVPLGKPGPYERLHAIDAQLDRVEWETARSALDALGIVERISTR
jgi:hypothetical protein